jgi:hypothetical protein
MEVRPSLGVVPHLCGVERDLPQQSAARELVERVVDRAACRREVDRARLLVERLCGEMPGARAKDRVGEVDALTVSA